MKLFEVKGVATLVFPNIVAESADDAIEKAVNTLPCEIKNGAGAVCFLSADDAQAECWDLMDTSNNHRAELVDSINKAWNEKTNDFFAIVRFLAERDSEDAILAKTDPRTACHDYCQYVADDIDLETILSYCRM